MTLDEVLELAAKVADRHKGAAERSRRAKKAHTYKFASDEARMEIAAEERGEDIAAEIIAREIRKLIGTLHD